MNIALPMLRPCPHAERVDDGRAGERERTRAVALTRLDRIER
jgi:hypothetical protein